MIPSHFQPREHLLGLICKMSSDLRLGYPLLLIKNVYQIWYDQDKKSKHISTYEVPSSKNRTIALDCAILITETFWILENFPWVMQKKTEQNGFFPTLRVIAQSLLETTPYPLPLPRFHSFLLMPKEPKSTNSSPSGHWSQIVFWITQKVFVVETNQRQF